MKFIFGFIAIVILAGCSESADSQLETRIRNLNEANNNLQRELSSCESMYKSLASQIATGSTTTNKPYKEPEYEEVSVYEVDGTKCYVTDDIDNPAPACGRSFWKCKDGVLRECMTNVKYKISKERKLVEEEE